MNATSPHAAGPVASGPVAAGPVVPGPGVTPPAVSSPLHLRGRHIVLVGYMGAGKSTVGRALAARLSCDFVDLDDVIAHNAGRSIAQVFAEDGEAGFRALESATLRQLRGDLRGGPRHVIATGGGIIGSDDNIATLRALGTCVWLSASAGALWRRIAGDPNRPLATQQGDPKQAAAAFAVRLAGRRTRYALAADDVVDACGTVDEVTAAVAAAHAALTTRAVVPVALSGRSYQVHVGPAALRHAALAVARLSPARALVVSDANVAPLWGEALGRALALVGVDFDTHTLSAGEPEKSLEAVAGIWDAVLAGGADRSTVVVALGGGVTGDLAGFAAATALRGLRVVQVPTTLLAMVDASVGGKTGFNHRLGKNLVGAFHQPSTVACDVDTLATLPPRERIAGLAEAVKIALTFDAELLDELEHHADALRAGDPGVTARVVAAAVALKAAVVVADEREGGVRRALNFGHTVGHAVERATDYTRFLHGEAVALGMVASLDRSVAVGTCTPALARRAVSLLQRLGLPTRLPPDVDRHAVRAALAHDKKRADSLAASGVRFILCAGPGAYADVWTALSDIPLEAGAWRTAREDSDPCP